MNLLKSEASPYLKQHSAQPINWYPWGEEAFESAKQGNKPIFLSIGYSTCHWCHVMAKESFEDGEVATLLNEKFISIKVDREEHPDVDSVYMEFASRLLKGGVGWPLNLFLTPDLKPFYAFTYMPPRPKGRHRGFIELMSDVSALWKGKERHQLIREAEELSKELSGLHQRAFEEKGLIPSSKHLKEWWMEAQARLFTQTDGVYGGLMGAPKFPMPQNILFLLSTAPSLSDPRAQFYVEKTLEKMRRGGIHDILAGGFSRYSVDEQWRIPHFEKMLSDNAQLIAAYLGAWKKTKNSKFLRVIKGIIDYLMRDLCSSAGAFYSAQDADSEGEEGKCYCWSPEEIERALGPEVGPMFVEIFEVDWEEGLDAGAVLYQGKSDDQVCEAHGLTQEEWLEWKNRQFEILKKVRDRRTQPFIDTKIITSHNAMGISALAKIAHAPIHTEYSLMEAAKKCVNFLREKMYLRGDNGLFEGLVHSYSSSTQGRVGCLEDYAFLTRAYLDLFEADGGSQYLQYAKELIDFVLEAFIGPNGLFYSSISSDLILQKISMADGAEPSGSGVMIHSLVRLWHLLREDKYERAIENYFSACHLFLQDQAEIYLTILSALALYLDQEVEVVVVALSEEASGMKDLKEVIASSYQERRIIIWKHGKDESLEKQIPWLKTMKPLNNQTTLYVCHQGACQRPLEDKSEIEAFLKREN